MALLASACGGGQDTDLDLSLSALDTKDSPAALSVPEDQTGEVAVTAVAPLLGDVDGVLPVEQAEPPADADPNAVDDTAITVAAPAAPAPPTTPALIVDDGSTPAPAAADLTTAAPITTAAPVTTPAPTTTAAPVTTPAPTTTAAPVTTPAPTTVAPTTAAPAPGGVGNLPNGNATNIHTGEQFKIGDYLVANGSTPILFWLWQPT